MIGYESYLAGFNPAPYLRPIRPHRWQEYENIIKNIYSNEKVC